MEVTSAMCPMVGSGLPCSTFFCSGYSERNKVGVEDKIKTNWINCYGMLLLIMMMRLFDIDNGKGEVIVDNSN